MISLKLIEGPGKRVQRGEIPGEGPIPPDLKVCVMVSFFCQPDWLAGCQDVWANTVLGVSVRMFLNEIVTEISRWPEANCPA